ncbi:MAG: hypothetical protein ACKPKO_47935, partial [Candidatus Fonsibacter sp.]
PPLDTIVNPPQQTTTQTRKTTDTTWDSDALWQSRRGQRRRPPSSVAANDLDPVKKWDKHDKRPSNSLAFKGPNTNRPAFARRHRD